MRPVGLVVVVLLTLASSIAEAQPAPTPRIGFLGAGNADTESRQVSAFRQGLRDLGWIIIRDLTRSLFCFRERNRNVLCFNIPRRAEDEMPLGDDPRPRAADVA